MNLSFQRLFQLVFLSCALLYIPQLRAQEADSLDIKAQTREAVKLKAEGNFEEAIPFFESLAEHYKKAALWDDYLSTYIDLSTCYAEMGLYDKAKVITDVLINQSADKVAQPARYQINGYTALGNINYGLSDFKEAEEAYNQSLTLSKKTYGDEDLMTADAHGNLAALYEKIGNHQKALEYNLTALKVREKLLDKDHLDLSYSYINIGLIYVKRDELNKALDYYLKAESIIRSAKGDYHPNLGVVLNNIGRVYQRKGENEKALSTYYKVVDIFKKALGENHPNNGMIKTNIGLIYLEENRFIEAKKEFQDSYDIWIQSLPEDHYYIGVFYNNIALVYAALSDFEKALVANEKGYIIYATQLGKNHPETCKTYNNEAIFLTSLERYDQALEACEKAFQNNIIKTEGDKLSFKDASYAPSELLRTYYTKANVYLKQFEKTNDLAFIRKAQEIQRIVEGFIDQRNKLYVTLDDQIIFNEYANACLKQTAHSHLKAYHSLQDDSELENLFRLTEKSKSKTLLQSTNTVNADQFAGIPIDIIKEERQIKENITLYESKALEFAQANDSIQLAEYRNEKLFNEKQKLEKLVNLMRKDYRAYHDMKYTTDVASIRDIQSVLDDQSLLVTYTLDRLVYDEYNSEKSPKLHIIYISKDDADVVSVDWKTENDEQAISFYSLIQKSSIVKTKNKNQFIKDGHALYQKLIKPIESKISDKQRLVIIGEDILSYIPFEALLKNENNQSFDKLDYLIKDLDVSYHYSATLFKNSSKDKPRTYDSNLLAFAPVFDNNSIGLIPSDQQRFYSDTSYTAMRDNRFQPLFWSEKEVLAIYDLFQERNKNQHKLLLRNDASEAALKANISKHNGIVHIASHSFANLKTPKFSGIACTNLGAKEDGILHVGEIYNLQLNADLVVLSSCESGLGQLKQGEGMLGLNRSFLYAGASNVLYSLWKVNDKTSSELMVEFYRQLLSKKSYPNALRESKLKLISQGNTALPKYWAPFVIVGR